MEYWIEQYWHLGFLFRYISLLRLSTLSLGPEEKDYLTTFSPASVSKLSKMFNNTKLNWLSTFRREVDFNLAPVRYILIWHSWEMVAVSFSSPLWDAIAGNMTHISFSDRKSNGLEGDSRNPLVILSLFLLYPERGDTLYSLPWEKVKWGPLLVIFKLMWSLTCN